MTTLREFLENDTTNSIYYIGAVEGNGFFFIGDSETALKEIPDISINKLTALQLSRDNYKVDIDHFKRIIGKDDHPMHKKQLAKKEAYLKKISRRISEWEPFLDREVLSVDPKISDDGYNVIISGFGEGRYWLYHEYNPAAVPKKKASSMHPDGYEDLKNAIVLQAVDDLKSNIKDQECGLGEPRDQRCSTANLTSFFEGEWFKDLCNINGKVVMREVKKRALEELEEEALLATGSEV